MTPRCVQIYRRTAPAVKAVGLDQFRGGIDDAAHLYCVDVARAGLQCEEGKQTSARAEIHEHVAGFHGAVNRFAIGIAASRLRRGSGTRGSIRARLQETKLPVKRKSPASGER